MVSRKTLPFVVNKRGLDIRNGSKLLESSEGDNFYSKFGKDITLLTEIVVERQNHGI